MSAAPTDANDPAPEAFAVSTTVSLQDQGLNVLKSGDTFAVFDRGGDIVAVPGGALGIYHWDTRHLSRLDLILGGAPLQLLGAAPNADNLLLISDMANPAIRDLDGAEVARGVIHLRRSLFLTDGGCHTRLAWRNFDRTRHRLRLELHVDADFVDQFEVRGMTRARRGDMLASEATRDSLTLSYRGLDGAVRVTRVGFAPAPRMLDANRAVFELDLAPQGLATIFVEAAFTSNDGAAAGQNPSSAFRAAYVGAKRRLRADTVRAAKISSSSETFNRTLRRAAGDLVMLVTDKPTGPYPYAGIPWFSTAFGRDALITALLTLAVDPAIASGVLRYLAQEQATTFDPDTEAEPGKVLHEIRRGEMAVLREVPFGRYYGSVDATPLFVMLAGAYLDRTGDIATLRAIWPQLDLALAWMDRRADADGFVRYVRSTNEGMSNQGWKDSYDSVSHADGTLARGAIALCEVQAYVFAARLAGAAVARQLGLEPQARTLEVKARDLRQAFEDRFWSEPLGTFVLALDGDDRPCAVRASNAGHVLMTGIAAEDRAHRVAAGLMGSAFFSGWGIRTMAEGEARYNPISYQNGSVWPHDNALIALGMARIGLRQHATKLLESMHAAASTFDLQRMPELFCGFPRRGSVGPTPFPVACAPQAWSAAAIPALVGACLGLSFDPPARTVRFVDPHLPSFLEGITLRNLSLRDARISVRVVQSLGKASVSVIDWEGDIDVVSE